MGHFSHVGLAMDFSEASKHAARTALLFAEEIGAERVTLLHAVEEVVMPHGGTDEIWARLRDLQSRIEATGLGHLEALAQELGGAQRVPVACAVVHGRPSRSIPKLAAEQGVDLLVLGCHSRTGLSRWIFGSVAETVLERATMPSLVIPLGADGQAVSPHALQKLSTIVVGIDLYARARDVLAAALEIARSHRGSRPRLVLCHVVDTSFASATDATADTSVGEYRETLKLMSSGVLAELAKIAEGEGVAATLNVVEGEPSEVLTGEAARLGAELLVVGSHGRGQAHAESIGSTTRQLVRASEVPVLVVPSWDQSGTA